MRDIVGMKRETVPGTTSEFFEAHHTSVTSDQFFEPHAHVADQLALVPGGARVRAGDSRWHLHGSHFAWVPALLEHDMQMAGAEDMYSLYLDQGLRLSGSRWSRPLVLPADDVAFAIVQSLCTSQLSESRAQASLALLFEILSVTRESYDALAVPSDARAREVAEALLVDPRDRRELTDWSAVLGVSTRTLHRAFLSDTGLSFTQWRTRARVYASERVLIEGASVQEAARRVGYGTTTGYIKAFKQAFGSTPAAYLRAQRRSRSTAAVRVLRGR